MAGENQIGLAVDAQPASRAIANMGVVDAAPAPLVFAPAAAPAPAPRRAAAFDPKEATLLGQFVEAAYSMFDADPTKLTPPASPDFPAGFRLAASIQMQDFVLFSTGPVFYNLSRRARRISTISCSPFAAPPVGRNGGTTPTQGSGFLSGSRDAAGSAPALRASTTRSKSWNIPSVHWPRPHRRDR